MLKDVHRPDVQNTSSTTNRHTNELQLTLRLLTPAVGRYITVADLIGQPLEVLGQVTVLVSIRDNLDALVQHVVAQLLEFAHILPSHKHEVFQVGLVFDRF